MSVKKISDVRTVRYEVKGEQPVSSYGSRPFDPREVVLVVDGGVVDMLWIHGIGYRSDGKLGKAKANGPFNDENAPTWALKLVADEGVKWPELEPGEEEEPEEEDRQSEATRLRWQIEHEQRQAKEARRVAAEHEETASRLIDEVLREAFKAWTSVEDGQK